MATKTSDGALGLDDQEPKVAAVIDFEEFVDDASDETWRRALRVAVEHVDALERNGRNR